MTRFMGKFTSRLDAKGRVSIPAPFRALLPEIEGAPRLALRPSHKSPCIECWTAAGLLAAAERLDRMDIFDDDHDDLAMTLFGQTLAIDPDREGRIVLPGDLASHARLVDAVTFIGMNRHFQIWEPAAGERRLAEANERSAARRLTLPGNAP